MAKIMVVDDEPGMRKSVAIMLRREGYDVTEAGNWEHASICFSDAAVIVCRSRAASTSSFGRE